MAIGFQRLAPSSKLTGASTCTRQLAVVEWYPGSDRFDNDLKDRHEKDARSTAESVGFRAGTKLGTCTDYPSCRVKCSARAGWQRRMPRELWRLLEQCQADPCLRWQIGTPVFVLKVGVSILLSMVAFASLLAGGYLWFQLWRAQGESYTQVALVIAKLDFAAGVLISLTVFIWNPVILVLLVFLGFSLIGALSAYWSIANPYMTANWWRTIERSHKSQSNEEVDEEPQ